MDPFSPSPKSTVSITVGAVSAPVKISDDGVLQVRVMNNGTATVWIEFGSATLAATVATGMPVGPGVTEVLTIDIRKGPVWVAAIAAAATGLVYFTPGAGI